MNSHPITQPYGISVFGSALTSAEPDKVVFSFSASSLKPRPKEAFAEAQTIATKLRQFLQTTSVGEFGASRLSLNETNRYSDGESRFVGYTAQIAFRVVLRDLDRFEEVITGLVDAGATEIAGVEFQSSNLLELRAEARRRAVAAARAKAENYCLAAQVQLGEVLHIEDVNPDTLKGRESHGWTTQPQVDDEAAHVFNPGAIIVGAAVQIAFALSAKA